MPYIGNSPANIGNYQVVDVISSTFNGTTTYKDAILAIKAEIPKPI